MKPCPECKFVYLDSDELCDLDGTQLIGIVTLIKANLVKAIEKSR